MDDANIQKPELFPITSAECRVVAEKLSSDPEGLNASGHIAPGNVGSIEKVMNDALAIIPPPPPRLPPPTAAVGAVTTSPPSAPWLI